MLIRVITQKKDKVECYFGADNVTVWFNYAELLSGGAAPVLTTEAATNIGETSFQANGTYTGGIEGQLGFCYIEGTSGTPTTSDSKVYDDVEVYSGTPAAYNKTVSSLSAETSYRVRAYAIDGFWGTVYGSTITVETTGGVPPTVYLRYWNGASWVQVNTFGVRWT